MSPVVVTVHVSRSAPGWHQTFLDHVLPVVERLARFQFRHLPNSEREEATAEAVAAAMIAFVGLTRRGRAPQQFASRLARFAVLRVVAGRLSSSASNSRDVLSRQARQRRGFRVESLDTGEIQTPDGWQAILVEDKKSTPAEVAASRVDFSEWLGRMTSRRREIAETLAQGYRTDEVAAKFRLSRARISQLRREFEASWREFQREAPSPELELSVT